MAAHQTAPEAAPVKRKRGRPRKTDKPAEPPVAPDPPQAAQELRLRKGHISARLFTAFMKDVVLSPQSRR